MDDGDAHRVPAVITRAAARASADVGVSSVVTACVVRGGVARAQPRDNHVSRAPLPPAPRVHQSAADGAEARARRRPPSLGRIRSKANEA
jgi:hypothetical protein